MTVDRRALLQGAGTAATLAMIAPLTGGFSRPAQAAPALPQKKSGQVPGIYRTRVGTIELTSILDGGGQFGLDLFPTAPDTDAKALQNQSFVPEGPVRAYFNTFVVRIGTRLVLIDTGYGNGNPDAGRLLQNLQAAGFAPADFNEIILTHAHPDHVLGLIDTAKKAVFPNAQIRIGATELAYWDSDEEMGKAPDAKKAMFTMARDALAPYRAGGKIATYAPNEDFQGGLTSVFLPGHTPGHSGVRISDGSDQLLIWGDIIHAPVLQFAHPEWSIAFDVDAAKALETRSKIMAEVAADRIRIAGMHLTFPGLGHVAASGTGYEFIPQLWEI